MLKIHWHSVALAPLALACGLAHGADPASADYQSGYAAGYRAAMEALRAGTPPPAGPPPGVAAVTPAAVAAPAAAPQRPAGPPDWWNHSSLLYPKLEPQWRHHAEVQLSGTSVSGNDDGFALRGGAKLFSRSGRWTNELKGSIDRRRIAQAGGALNMRDYRFLEESFRYDFTPKAYASAGILVERDDVNYIEQRGTVLAGLGYYLLDTSKLRINLFGGLGRLHERYMEPVPTLIGVSARGSGLLYLYQTVDWEITPDWSLQQGFRHMRDTDRSGVYGPDPTRPGLYRAVDQVHRYRNAASVALTYKLAPRASVSLVVESRYDSNPWPEVEPHDITRRLMFNLQY